MASLRVGRFSFTIAFSRRKVEVRSSSRVEYESRDFEMDLCKRDVADDGKIRMQTREVIQPGGKRMWQDYFAQTHSRWRRSTASRALSAWPLL